jgi:isocitrate/isopropylmalate dehydrogenase
MVLWDEVAYEVAAEFSHVTLDKMLVDAMVSQFSSFIPTKHPANFRSYPFLDDPYGPSP